MISFLVRSVILFLAALVGLWVADIVLADVTTTFPAVLIAAAIFGVLQAVLFPFMVTVARRNAAALVGAVGLLTAFVALVVTAVVSNGVSVSGAITWLYAALVVWLATMVATLVLPLIMVKAGISAARQNRASN